MDQFFFFLKEWAVINIGSFFQIIYFNKSGNFSVYFEIRMKFPGGGPEVFSGVFFIAERDLSSRNFRILPGRDDQLRNSDQNALEGGILFFNQVGDFNQAVKFFDPLCKSLIVFLQFRFGLPELGFNSFQFSIVLTKFLKLPDQIIFWSVVILHVMCSPYII
jgi:hypothetical protein